LSLAAIVTTFNEEACIGECLSRLQFADELLVVDSFSTDRTAELAGRHGARVLQHEYLSPAAQKNWAVTQTSSDWLLIVDADELVTEELAEEVRRTITSPRARDGYHIKRRNFFLGNEIRYAGWQNDWVLRLFRRGRGRYPDRQIHEQLTIDGSVGRLHGRLLHHSYRSLDDYWRKLRRYADWNAAEARRQGARVSPLYMMVHPPLRFWKAYLLRGGFLDGVPGLVVSVLTAVYAAAKDIRIWEDQWRSGTRSGSAGKPLVGCERLREDDSPAAQRAESP
jgi:glycosyltransferase involved in cell wall biosynthesis